VCQTAVPPVATRGQQTHRDVADSQPPPFFTDEVLQDPVIPELGFAAALCCQVCEQHQSYDVWDINNNNNITLL